MEAIGDFQVGPWLAQPSLNRLSGPECVKHLRPRTMDVLVRLALAAPLVVTREELLCAVWPDQHIEDEGLTHCVAELRDAFGDHALHGTAADVPGTGPPTVSQRTVSIETIPKRGYRLNAIVQWHPSPIERPLLGSGLVVLPLDDLGPERDACFRDGLTEACIASLAAIPGVRVVSRTSTKHLGDEPDLRAVAARLRVSYALEGAIRRAGTRTVITIRLLDVAGDTAVWSRSFTEDGSDGLDVQQRTAQAVAVALQPLLTT